MHTLQAVLGFERVLTVRCALSSSLALLYSALPPCFALSAARDAPRSIARRSERGFPLPFLRLAPSSRLSAHCVAPFPTPPWPSSDAPPIPETSTGPGLSPHPRIEGTSQHEMGVSTKLPELDRLVTKILPYNPYDPYWEVYKDWYTSPLVKRPWSCDWSQWCGVDWFAHNTIEAFYNTGFNIPGKIEPLAFFEAGAGATWFFTANLMYYFYHDERDVVLRFERAFSSHDEFFVWEHREWNKRHCTWTSEIRRCAPRVPLTTRLPLPPWLGP
ncbi:hypothetical protein FB451DRAFT_1414387 [Mycena latifolia]|nr:hypothetical protein FB451DRAFT_1414387 [Mycena latifolia]